MKIMLFIERAISGEVLQQLVHLGTPTSACFFNNMCTLEKQADDHLTPESMGILKLRSKIKNLPKIVKVPQYSWHFGMPSFQSTSSTTEEDPRARDEAAPPHLQAEVSCRSGIVTGPKKTKLLRT